MEYVLGLGSNLGSRHAHLELGLLLLRARTGCEIASVSPSYGSDPLTPPQPRYLNAAARIRTSLQPAALLQHLHAVEREFGRQRERELRWGPRTLDLDILWASVPVQSERLTIPHPRLHERGFALRPLLDVAPELGPQYGPALRQLAPQALDVPAPPHSTILRRTHDTLELRSRAEDRADALAAALRALANELWGVAELSTATSHGLQGDCAAGDELATCAREALTRIASDTGPPLCAATLDCLADGHFELRLFAASPSREAQPRAWQLQTCVWDEPSTTLQLHVRAAPRTRDRP